MEKQLEISQHFGARSQPIGELSRSALATAVLPSPAAEHFSVGAARDLNVAAGGQIKGSWSIWLGSVLLE